MEGDTKDTRDTVALIDRLSNVVERIIVVAHPYIYHYKVHSYDKCKVYALFLLYAKGAL